MTQLLIMCAYLAVLVGLGFVTNRKFRGTARDYFAASHSIGSVVLLLSVFGATMTAFALIGSTSESYRSGIGVYGMLASWSGFVHTAVFFFVGLKLWAIGKRYGYLTQVQYFRDRFECNHIGLALFPFLVGLVIPYILTALISAEAVTTALTRGAFPEAFAETNGGVPPWLSGLVICLVVLAYIFFGGLRGAAWANALQTFVFIGTGIAAFYLISRELGGISAATQAVLASHPEKLMRQDSVLQSDFFFYCLIPLSVGTFPHVFQHWLTARSAETFKLTIVAHPIFILILWLPCVLLGVWATSAILPDGSLVIPLEHPPNTELAILVEKLTTPLVGAFLGAGILAAIMSSLDSQFLCLSSIFANDIVAHYWGEDRVDDKRRLFLGRVFVVAAAGVAYLLSLAEPRAVFQLGVWAFSGFTALFPLVVAALYWRGATTAGAYACILTSAAAWIFLFRESGYGADLAYRFYGLMPVVPIFAASIVALVGVSLATRAPSAATIDKFFPRRARE